MLPAGVAVEAPVTSAPATTTTLPVTTTVTTTTEVPTTTATVPATETTVEAETSTVAPGLVLKSIAPAGQRAAGNRVLMIGDSVLAGTSPRYSNDMCETMVPLGWKVEVDAEVGRFIDFADRVLDKRQSAGWDAAVIFLGSNYGEDQALFASLLESAVDRLSPMPVVLVTVTEFEPSRADVNAAIRLIAFNHPNVSVVDWAAVSASDPTLLSGDDLHPTPRGRQVLAYHVAGAFGDAPTASGECLKTSFRDDSAGSVVTGTTGPVKPSVTTRRSTTPSKSTTKPTTKPTSTASPTSGSGTTSKPTTPTTADVPKTTAEPVHTTAEPVRTTEEPPKATTATSRRAAGEPLTIRTRPDRRPMTSRRRCRR